MRKVLFAALASAALSGLPPAASAQGSTTAGAAAGGIAGAVVGGPIGAALGAGAGAVIGSQYEGRRYRVYRYHPRYARPHRRVYRVVR